MAVTAVTTMMTMMTDPPNPELLGDMDDDDDDDDETQPLPAAKKVAAAPPSAKKGGMKNALAGISVCFTGAQPRLRSTLEKMVEDNGGTVLGGVSKNLTYLVMANPDSNSTKAQKARAFGTKCINLDSLEKFIRERGGAV